MVQIYNGYNNNNRCAKDALKGALTLTITLIKNSQF